MFLHENTFQFTERRRRAFNSSHFGARVGSTKIKRFTCNGAVELFHSLGKREIAPTSQTVNTGSECGKPRSVIRPLSWCVLKISQPLASNITVLLAAHSPCAAGRKQPAASPARGVSVWERPGYSSVPSHLEGRSNPTIKNKWWTTRDLNDLVDYENRGVYFQAWATAVFSKEQVSQGEASLLSASRQSLALSLKSLMGTPGPVLGWGKGPLLSDWHLSLVYQVCD